MTDTGEICHYLEASSTYTQQQFSSTLIPTTTTLVTVTGIGTGRNNTQIILDFFSTNPSTECPAAYYAANHTNGGLNDWFLPSRLELNQLMTQINNGSIGWDSTYPYSYVWSSTVTSGGSVGCLDRLGNAGSQGSTQNLNVHPIRAF